MGTMRIIVEGNVQGIGYRAFTKYLAQQYGLNGLVRNVSGGKVEIFCEGEEKTIMRFIESLYIKTDSYDIASPNVTKIRAYPKGTQSYEPAWKEYSGFEIDYGADELTNFQKMSLEDSELAKLQFWYLRNEVKLLKSDINNNFESLRSDTNNNFELLGSEMNNYFAQLRSETNNNFELLGSEMSNNFAQLRSDTNNNFELLRSETNNNFAQLRSESNNNFDLLRSETNNNFDETAKRYGEISVELKATKDKLEKSFDELPERIAKALIEEFKKI